MAGLGLALGAAAAHGLVWLRLRGGGPEGERLRRRMLPLQGAGVALAGLAAALGGPLPAAAAAGFNAGALALGALSLAARRRLDRERSAGTTG